MSSAAAVLVAVALVLAAAGSALLAQTKPVPAPAAEPAAPKPPERADLAGPPSAGKTKARAGRFLSVEEAVRELDLIRPSRQRRAEDFTVPTWREGTFRLGEHRGKLVLLNFWATWCPPCVEEMPAFERLHRQHKDAGLVMVAVSLDTDPAKVAPFVREHRLTFTIGLDPGTKVADRYGVRALPSTFVIDPEGHLAALALGPRTWDNDAAHSLIEAMAR